MSQSPKGKVWVDLDVFLLNSLLKRGSLTLETCAVFTIRLHWSQFCTLSLHSTAPSRSVFGSTKFYNRLVHTGKNFTSRGGTSTAIGERYSYYNNRGTSLMFSMFASKWKDEIQTLQEVRLQWQYGMMLHLIILWYMDDGYSVSVCKDDV